MLGDDLIHVLKKTKYFISFVVFVLVSIAFFRLTSNNAVNTDDWEKSSAPQSQPVELIGVYPDLYWTIVIKSEDGKIYVNYGGSQPNWINIDQSDFVMPNDVPEEYSMKECSFDDMIFKSFFKKNVKIFQCYQLRVQYPEAASRVTVVLDQNGQVWQNNQWLDRSGLPEHSVSNDFIPILLFASILEIFWIILNVIKNKLIQMFKNKRTR